MKRGFLIDMDGVIYRSSQLIPGAVDFVKMLQRMRIPFLFLTNNSQRTRRECCSWGVSPTDYPRARCWTYRCAAAS